MNYSTYKKVPTLEYCKITRAAELLDCSVDDLLYWAEERKIKICIKVQDLKGMLVVPAISEPEQLLMFLCELMHGEHTTNIMCRGYGDIKPYPLSKVYAEEIYDLETENDFLLFSEATIARNGFDVRIDGLWELANITMGLIDYYDKENPPAIGGECSETRTMVKLLEALDFPFENGMRHTLNSTSFVLRPADTLDEVGDFVFMGYEQEKPISLSLDNLYVTKTQIKNIISNLMIPFDDMIKKDNAKKTNTTKKQSEFTVGILKEIGFTNSDLSGSISELRKKIARKLPTVSVPADDKSLIDWLRKGGIDR